MRFVDGRNIDVSGHEGRSAAYLGVLFTEGDCPERALSSEDDVPRGREPGTATREQIALLSGLERADDRLATNAQQ